MKVLVDACIWSLALRRGASKDHHLVKELSELIKEVRVQIIGPIRQELLSGVKSQKQFNELKFYLSAFPDLQLETTDFEQAAAFFNINRKHGIQGSNTDFLICAAAYRLNLEIFTCDKDFELFQKHIPIKLYSSRVH